MKRKTKKNLQTTQYKLPFGVRRCFDKWEEVLGIYKKKINGFGPIAIENEHIPSGYVVGRLKGLNSHILVYISQRPMQLIGFKSRIGNENR